MKLFAGLALATLALTASACTETTTVWGDWRTGQAVAGGCQTFLLGPDVHVNVYDDHQLIASEEAACDDLGFSTEIPLGVTDARVTATDAQGGQWEHRFDLDKELGYIYVGVILFDHGSSGD